MKKEKTELIDGIGEVIKVGTSCVGNMAWETPYVVFRVYCESCDLPFGDYKWQSENIYTIAYKMDKVQEGHLTVGKFFNLEIRVRGNKIWRVNRLEYR